MVDTEQDRLRGSGFWGGGLLCHSKVNSRRGGLRPSEKFRSRKLHNYVDLWEKLEGQSDFLKTWKRSKEGISSLLKFIKALSGRGRQNTEEKL